MKESIFLSLGLVGLSTASYVNSLTQYIKDIPECALSAMKEALNEEGCSLSTADAKEFDCICDHMYDMDAIVYDKVSHSCAADFAKAAGFLCGAWEVESITASDLAQATKALGDKLGLYSLAIATGVPESPQEAVQVTQPVVANRAPAPTGRVVQSLGVVAVAAAML